MSFLRFIIIIWPCLQALVEGRPITLLSYILVPSLSPFKMFYTWYLMLIMTSTPVASHKCKNTSWMCMISSILSFSDNILDTCVEVCYIPFDHSFKSRIWTPYPDDTSEQIARQMELQPFRTPIILLIFNASKCTLAVFFTSGSPVKYTFCQAFRRLLLLQSLPSTFPSIWHSDHIKQNKFASQPSPKNWQ